MTALIVWLCTLTLALAFYAVARLAHAAFVLWVGRGIEEQIRKRLEKLEQLADEQHHRINKIERERVTPSRR